MEITNKAGKYYSAEENIQIVVSLLKANGIRRVFASPGTTNLTFVASLQQDPFFMVYSAPEERSAAYMAVGMAAETGEPVVITCTGATASRNYLPAMTEAFYRKLPILAVTATQPRGLVGNLVPQVIDRSSLPVDTAVYSVHIGTIKDCDDRHFAEIKVNEALHFLRRNGGGPVHINLETTYSKDFSVRELPSVRKIDYYQYFDSLPELPSGKIGVFVGAHAPMSEELTKAIDTFCAAHNSAVFCDHTSGYQGNFRVQFPLLNSQDNWSSPASGLRLMVYIGEVSGSYSQPGSSEMWRVSPDGRIRDPYGNITAVFEMRELDFFRQYAGSSNDKGIYYTECLMAYNETLENIPEVLPFSNIAVARSLHKDVPSNAVMHFGILNSLRSWNFFTLPETVESFCNVGGFGIDGPLSTAIGGALAHPNHIHFLMVGDLAFFYDMNALGNRHLPKNLRILLVNNGRGTEFTNYNHPAYTFGEDADVYLAAAGHYGHQSPELVRHYAQDLGFTYMSASNIEEINDLKSRFLDPNIGAGRMLLEVFTDSENENEALYIMRHLRTGSASLLMNTARKALGKKGIEIVKKVLGI